MPILPDNFAFMTQGQKDAYFASGAATQPITSTGKTSILGAPTLASINQSSGQIEQKYGQPTGTLQRLDPITSTMLVPQADLSSQVATPQVTPPPTTTGLDTSVTAPPPVDPYANNAQETEVQRRINEQLGLNDSIAGKQDYQTQQETAAGLPDLYKTQTELSTRVKQLQNEANAIPLQLQQDATGRGITTGGLQPIQTAALRNNAIQALAANSLLESSKGNITIAQNLVDRAVAAKYGPLEAKYEANSKNLALIMNSPNYTNAEKKKAADQQAIVDKKKADIETKKADTSTIMSWASAALANGATTYQAQQIMNIAQSDKPDLKAAFALYGPYAKDPNATKMALLDLEAKRATIEGTKANTAQSYASAAKTNAEAKAALNGEAAVSPDILNGMLNVYKATGVIPAFGNSAKSPLRAQFYAALGGNTGGQIVSDASANKSVRAGLNTALSTQTNLLAANKTAINTLDQQLALAQQYSDKIDRSGSPFISKYLLAAKSGVFGDPDTAAFNNIVKTASNEFAKILSGSAASIGGVTVSSAADAENMLNTALSKGQFTAVIDLMKKESQYRLTSQQGTIDQLTKDLSNVGSLTNSLQNSTTKSGAPFDYEAAKKAGYTDEEIKQYINAN